MREFTAALPVVAGVIELDDVPVDLTDDDADDLNAGLSITTLTTTGEEIAVYPKED